MPAVRTIPIVADFLRAWEGALRGEKGADRSVRRGGVYDLVAGPSALLWARMATRDRDSFRATYADTASSEDLDRIVRLRYGVERSRSTFGRGVCVFARPEPGAAGSILAGTRVEAGQSAFVVEEDAPVRASDVAVVSRVRAAREGSNVAASVSRGLSCPDALFDPTLAPVSLSCGDGADEERDADLLARGRRALPLRKTGTETAIRSACASAGAANVTILDAGIFGDARDFGVTHVYVGDASFRSPPGLVDACAAAIERSRVLGCDAAILGMVPVPVSVSLDVELSDDPASFDLSGIARAIVASEVSDFSVRKDFWLFSSDSLAASAVRAAGSAARTVTATSDPPAPVPAFVPVLPRYSLAGRDVSISFRPPAQ